MDTKEQRAKSRERNVNKHIKIANAILRKGGQLTGKKLDEWRKHTQEAERLIGRYTENKIV